MKIRTILEVYQSTKLRFALKLHIIFLVLLVGTCDQTNPNMWDCCQNEEGTDHGNCGEGQGMTQ